MHQVNNQFSFVLRFCCVILLCSLGPFAAFAKTVERTYLLPHFVVGQVFRYGVQTKIETTSAASGPVMDPQAVKKLSESVDILIRLQILSVSQTSVGNSARIRVTYEKAVATTDGAPYDPEVSAIQEQYQKLAGQSFEFTLAAGGKISNVTDLQKIALDPSRAAVLNQWLAQLALGASLPKQGIAVGEKWSTEQPLENIPLDGLAWKTRATYLRNEPCPASAQNAASVNGKPLTPAPAADTCAVIMTRSVITGGSRPKDRTPAVFRQNGLRTSGVWTGSGEALTAISLRTGMVASVTQTGSTHMDFTIMTATASNRMRYAGDTRTQTEITLVAQSAVP